MAPNRTRQTPVLGWLLVLPAMSMLAVTVGCKKSVEPSPRTTSQTEDTLTNGDVAKFAITIHSPLGPPTIKLTQADPQGRVGEVACSTCHSVREPNHKNRTPADLDQFHQNMTFAHGNLTCYACHNPADADTLHLADSTKIEYTQVMTLCGQCHGSQVRDYEHGVHGGMNGYWDMSRGGRTRNSCVDCHDPHVPKFPTMQPTFKPRDRFLTSPQSSEAQHD